MLLGSHTPLVSTLAWTPDARWIAFSGRPSEDQPVPHMADREQTIQRLGSSRRIEHNGVERRFQPRVSRRMDVVSRSSAKRRSRRMLFMSAGLGRAERDFSAITRHTGTLRLSRRCMDAGRRRSSALVRRASGLSRMQRMALGPTRLEPSGEPEHLPFGEHARPSPSRRLAGSCPRLSPETAT